jgi:hypothetical protein
MDSALLWVQVAATVFVAVTVIVLWLQLRAMRSASTAQNILAVLNYLQDAQVREARCVVQTDLGSKPPDLWTEVEKEKASLVYSTYDVTGILIRQGLVPEDVFIDYWGESMVRCYKVLEPYLQALRRQADGGQYGDQLKWLCDKATRRGNSGGV